MKSNQGTYVYMSPFCLIFWGPFNMLKLTEKEIDLLYAQMLETLDKATIVVKFKKKDGSIRVMIGTRNKMTIQAVCNNDLSGMLAGFDKRANIGNHNIPVVDLALGEVRTFCVARLEAYQMIGIVNTTNMEAAFEYYNKVQEYAEKERIKEIEEKKETGSLVDLV